MQKYAFRKMTKDDFRARVNRVNRMSGVAPRVQDRAADRPFLSLLGGFFWTLMVLTVARNRDQIRESLSQGTLPAQYHDHVIHALGALLAVSVVVLGLHLLRYFGSRRKGAARRNSGKLLFGTCAALALVYTPSGVVDAGLGLLDDDTRAMVLSASSGVRAAMPVDMASMVFTSSQAVD